MVSRIFVVMIALLAVAVIGVGIIIYLLIDRNSPDPAVNTNQPSTNQPNDNSNQQAQINTFDECVKAGNQIMESYPRRCTANGLTYTEDIGNEIDKANLIKITRPRPNEAVSSPLSVTGQARGTWYFEATFPVKLYDPSGNLLIQSFATAQGSWMTENFVPFTATLNFNAPATKGKGYLVLEKSNASGDPERDDALRIPVIFN